MANVLVGIGSKLLLSLVTEAFAKALIYRSLLEITKRTDNKLDDDILAEIKKAWNV